MPDWKAEIRQRLAALHLAPMRENAIVEEFSQHLDEMYESLLASGVTATEAHQQTLAELKDSEWLMRGLSHLERQATSDSIVLGTNHRRNMIADLWQDLRFGVRLLRQKPGFTLVAVLTLALGIGANTAIFSVVNAVLVRALPFGEAESLVYLWNTNPALGAREGYFTDDEVLAIRERVNSCAAVSAWLPFNVVVKGQQPERVEGMIVETNFFQTLKAQPLLGRAFDKSDDDSDEEVVIIGYGLWQRQFGGDPNLIGQKVNVEGFGTRQHILLGVMPPDFDFPPRIEVWLPYGLAKGRTDNHYLRAIARLSPGVSSAQAQAELTALARQASKGNAGWEVTAMPFREFLFGSAQTALPLLFGAVGCVLLIACTNVANLQLARATARQKEIAVRRALGAGRGRIVRQLLTESLLLALAGGALGLLLTRWLLAVLCVLGPSSLPQLQEVSINAQALWFTLGLALLTGVLFGLAPAWQASNPDLHFALKDSGLLATVSVRGKRFRQALIVTQVALAMVLLVGAGLLVKSFWQVRQVKLGIAAESVLTVTITPSLNDYPHGDWRRTNFYQQVLSRIGTLPGVVAAGATSQMPLSGREVDMAFEIKGRAHRQASQHAELRIVTPSYFETLRIPLLAGRFLTDRDTNTSPRLFLINETLARRYFPGRNPLGERLKFGDFEGAIAGVVGDVRQRGLEADALPEMYISYLQKPMLWPTMNLVIRTTADPALLAASVRQTIQAVDPHQPIYNMQPMEQVLSASLAARRFSMLLLAAFAVLAVLLAAAGIYGVISYAVAERTREIGIRLALGAQAGDVLRLVAAQGMKPVLLGIVCGSGAAYALTRLLKSLLFGVSATDPLTFGVIALLLLGVALLACWVPARRATKIDPLLALRCE